MRLINCYLVFCFCPLLAQEPLRYISQSTVNIGDDFPTIAVKRFLPVNAIAVDREFISEFTHDSKVNTVVSGWFMHHRGAYWDLPIPPPEKSWPPSDAINPFFISIHFTGSLYPTVFSNKSIEYLKKHAPIGARDLTTLRELQNRGIPSYFSGCLTLTLENTCPERNDTIYLVDLDDETIAYIRSKTSSPIVVLTHGQPLLQLLCPDHRLKYSEFFLDRYRGCKCVVSTRLHATLPCLAFETPVLMISSDRKGTPNGRFSGLVEHSWNCSKEALLNGEINYDFDHPQKNPNTHLPIRENLINIMKEWVSAVH